jgi:hypothetical protein
MRVLSASTLYARELHQQQRTVRFGVRVIGTQVVENPPVPWIRLPCAAPRFQVPHQHRLAHAARPGLVRATDPCRRRQLKERPHLCLRAPEPACRLIRCCPAWRWSNCNSQVQPGFITRGDVTAPFQSPASALFQRERPPPTHATATASSPWKQDIVNVSESRHPSARSSFQPARHSSSLSR